jgi:hypothetical protein
VQMAIFRCDDMTVMSTTHVRRADSSKRTERTCHCHCQGITVTLLQLELPKTIWRSIQCLSRPAWSHLAILSMS